MIRRILHVDLDAFFASVEQLDHPELRGKPVIVGGVGRRGVVATCSYEARVYGVHSAMPGFMAKKLCPKGIFVHGHMDRYSEVSRQVFKILEEVTDNIQQVSIDEAYLDVTNLYQSPVYIAEWIKTQIKKRVGITISVGISYNKFLAKIASDWNKPDGFMEINKENRDALLLPLQIRKVHGLGKKSVERLNRIGIFTIGDLRKYDREFLVDFLGKHGVDIYERIRGIDYRPVGSEKGGRKSIGRETTLKEDTQEYEELCGIIEKFAKKIFESMDRKQVICKTVTIKTKTYDFVSHTKSKTLLDFITTEEALSATGRQILKEIDLSIDIRLIGLSVSNFMDKESEQLTLFSAMDGL